MVQSISKFGEYMYIATGVRGESMHTSGLPNTLTRNPPEEAARLSLS